jgi:hypothetical protein
MIPGFVLCSPLPAAFDRVLQVPTFSIVQHNLTLIGNDFVVLA